ncbi:MAG: hypothetical protein J6S75_12075 [Thermoguttaceae bacterium]|nr:hypothetical protein [Thermoguttaceae bacterium]
MKQEEVRIHDVHVDPFCRGQRPVGKRGEQKQTLCQIKEQENRQRRFARMDDRRLPTFGNKA